MILILDIMTIEDLTQICSRLKGVTTDIKWKDHLCFNIGEKIFLITSPESLPLTASFKVSDEDFLTLSEREGIHSVNISPFVKLSLLRA